LLTDDCNTHIIIMITFPMPTHPLQVYLARKAPARLDSSAYVSQALPDGANGMSSVMERRYVIKKMDRQQADTSEVGWLFAMHVVHACHVCLRDCLL